jgi:WhiB family transcriptional regulator, redox-sensing transcriptional regulator
VSAQVGRRRLPPVQDEAWLESAECAGMDPALFFPARGDFRAVDAARAVCSGCPVRSECLAYAISHSEHYGVWGGTSERQRRRIRAAGRAAA